MGHIWKSLVADPKSTIDEYLDLVIDDLLTQCGSRLWRSREASCLALADIIQGRKFSQVIILLSLFLYIGGFPDYSALSGSYWVHLYVARLCNSFPKLD